jgi:choline-glycine betaine transporter
MQVSEAVIECLKEKKNESAHDAMQTSLLLWCKHKKMFWHFLPAALFYFTQRSASSSPFHPHRLDITV